MVRILLLLISTAIFAIGLVMIFSTTSAEVLDLDLDRSTHQALVRQIYYALGGLTLAGALWVYGYRKLLAISPWLLLFFTILLVLVLIPGIGREVNGSKRWLHIAGFSFQPSEFIKYVLPAFFINRISLYDHRQITLREFLKIVGLVAIPILLILIEPNNGTAAVITITMVVLCMLTRIPVKFWAMPLLVFIMIGGISAYHLPYVSARVKVYLNPELDIKGKGHQPWQAKIAAGSGRLFGKGPGNSLQKLSYLPEAQNDYIAAIYAEEFGFLGIVFLIFLYMTLTYIGFHIAATAENPGGYYLGGAITFLICFQAFLNLGVVSGILPSTGLNLPLFSQGGSSLMANIIGIGLLLSILEEHINPACYSHP
jgi:cell division protein FtsW